jgi:hypothetical protein
MKFPSRHVLNLLLVVLVEGASLPALATPPAKGFVSEIAPPPPPNQLQSLAIVDQTVLRNSGVDFTLARTLGQIISTAKVTETNTAANREAFLATMIKTFSTKTVVNPQSKVTITMTARPGEAALVPSHLLNPSDADGMRLVGLFNRLDQAPANWAYCGEYRMIYEKGNPVSLGNRFTMIFEAALDNPHPELGAKGCLPVAQFWAGLTTQSGTTLAKSVETFFYKGLPGFTPVVSFQNYGSPFGQIRANMFVNNAVWQLRQWLVAKNGTGSVSFVMAPVQNSPLIALYGQSMPGEDPNLTALRKSFQSESNLGFLQQLTSTDQLGKTEVVTSSQLFFKLGVAFKTEYDGYESTTTAPQDDPSLLSTSIPGLQSAINALGLPWALSAKEVLARAGTQSCGGCHGFASNEAMGPSSTGSTVTWPTTAFVHIDENGLMSQALSNFFLPERLTNLNAFIANQTEAVTSKALLARMPADTSLTTEIDYLRSSLIDGVSETPTASLLGGINDTVYQLRAINEETAGAFVRVRSAD